MSRLTIGLVLVSLGLGGVVRAETQAEIANRENEEGKELMFAGKYPDASAKFRDAVARVPEAKYFFNLCTSLYQEGKFGEALTACNSVDKNNPPDELKAKNAKLVDKIRDEAKAQGVDVQPTGGGGGDPNLGNPVDPNNPPTNPGDPNANPGNPGNPGPGNPGQPPPPGYGVGRAPSVGLFQARPPSHEYTWSLGVDFFGGGANIGNGYGSVSGGVRFKGDYMVLPAAKLGVQGYLQITNVGAGSNDPNAYALDIFDVGLAAYKHFCFRGRACFTPLLGASIALMDPNQDQGTGDQTFNYAAIGIRAEADLSYSFGRRYEYVLAAMIGVDGYTPVISSPSDGPTAMQVGLDRGGGIGYAGIGFTYRFNTPFGQAPFVTLE